MTALHLAAKHDAVDIVDLLIGELDVLAQENVITITIAS